MDLATLAGLLPSAVFTEVLDNNGAVADADYLLVLPISISWWWGRCRSGDLPARQPENHSAVREGTLQTRHGVFSATAYQDTTQGRLHVALTKV